MTATTTTTATAALATTLTQQHDSETNTRLKPRAKMSKQNNIFPTNSMPDQSRQSAITVNDQQPLALVWRNVFLFAALHVGALIGLYQAVFMAQWHTLIFAWSCHLMGGLGITAGVHRLWSHRSYKAKLPLRLILVVFQTMALQNDVIEWARDHRGHHKWSDTDADPHNSNRGLFFSHMGWLLHRKHAAVKDKGQTLDLSDLYADPVLRFQRNYYKILAILTCFVLPTLIPYFGWNESLMFAFYVNLLRYTVTLHCTWMVNSVAHRFGNRPYDQHIEPRQSVVTALIANGEGWHNYHHTFPYDYKTAETPYTLNTTTLFIDFFAWIGWVTDRKTVSEEAIRRTRENKGDGEHTWAEY